MQRTLLSLIQAKAFSMLRFRVLLPRVSVVGFGSGFASPEFGPFAGVHGVVPKRLVDCQLRRWCCTEVAVSMAFQPRPYKPSLLPPNVNPVRQRNACPQPQISKSVNPNPQHRILLPKPLTDQTPPYYVVILCLLY